MHASTPSGFTDFPIEFLVYPTTPPVELLHLNDPRVHAVFALIMAFYSRYVPPQSGAAPVKKPDPTTTSSKATALGKRKRADGSQSRLKYAESHGKGAESAQRHKGNPQHVEHPVDKDDVNGEAKLPSKKHAAALDEKLLTGEAAETSKRKKEKRKKSKDEAGSKVVASDSKKIEEEKDLDDDAAKHQSILSKFKKSRSRSAAAQEEGDQDRSAHVDQEEPEKVEKHGLTPLPQPEDAAEDDAPAISGLPEWLAKPLRVPSSGSKPFSTLDLGEETARALQTAGYEDALPVQSTVIPSLLQRGDHFASDLCISAPTGSGKTLAYTLPILEDLKGRPSTKLRAIVVVPTRELVTQVRQSFRFCGAENKISIGTASGDKALKEEQTLLVEKSVNYDPDAYIRRKNKSVEDIEDELLEDVLDMDQALAQMALSPDFVVAYESKIDVLICTPGRLVEHLRCTKGFSLESVRWLVIDEADRLLDQSFQEWTESVIPILHTEPEASPTLQRFRAMAQVVPRKRIRKVVLSATMTRDLGKLAGLRLHRPQLVVVEGGNRQANGDVDKSQLSKDENAQASSSNLPERLKEMAIPVKRDGEKPLYLVELIKDQMNEDQIAKSKIQDHVDADDSETSSEGSSDEHDDSSSTLRGTETNSAAKAATSRGMLVFTNSNESALRLARLLAILQPSWESKIKSLTKSAGTASGRRAIHALTSGRVAVLVASDRASRGLDLPDLAHVVSYDMPASRTSYVHRVGRTARANKPGRATTLVGFHEAKWFWHEIARTDTITRPRKVARDDGFFRRISKAMAEDLEAALEQLGREAVGER